MIRSMSSVAFALSLLSDCPRFALCGSHNFQGPIGLCLLVPCGFDILVSGNVSNIVNVLSKIVLMLGIAYKA